MLQSKVIFELVKILNKVYLNFDYALFKFYELIYYNFKDTQADIEMFEELDTSVISLKAKSSKEVLISCLNQREYTYPSIWLKLQILERFTIVGKHILCVGFLVFKMRLSQSCKGSIVKNFNLQLYIGFCNISGKNWQVYSIIINTIRK